MLVSSIRYLFLALDPGLELTHLIYFRQLRHLCCRYGPPLSPCLSCHPYHMWRILIANWCYQLSTVTRTTGLLGLPEKSTECVSESVSFHTPASAKPSSTFAHHD